MSGADLGVRGENIAAKLLADKGYEILCRRYRCFSGEVDIIAEKDDVIAFVEVKTRTGRGDIAPALAVTRAKRARIISAALDYIANHVDGDKVFRLDIIEILHTGGGFAARHTENAFEFGI